ncbi:hypothetical protein ACE38W_00905 [Chitinophaga sp. Hz27]|uniref:hypothetical protein n=1 Tax=Chitinophaga sp. Hz27 TaxID=3347169 RepID=UPI0035E290AB
MNTEIIIHTLVITRAGEQQYFQLNIPRHTTAIYGIMNSVQLIDVPPIGATGQIGSLQFQSTGRTNDCYNSIVKLEPAVALKGDLGLKAYQAGFIRETALLTNGIAQRGVMSAEVIQLPPCNNFYGNYKDTLGKGLNKDVKYRISITLWTTKKSL